MKIRFLAPFFLLSLFALCLASCGGENTDQPKGQRPDAGSTDTRTDSATPPTAATADAGADPNVDANNTTINAGHASGNASIRDTRENPSSSKATVAEQKIKCANPVAIDDVPSNWAQIEGEELITGKNGRYELLQIQLHGVVDARNGKKASAMTNTLFLSRSPGNERVAQMVSCKDMAGLEHLSFNITPLDSISTKDGRYEKRRSIEFFMHEDGVRHSAKPFSVRENAQFGKETKQTKALVEKLRADGIRYDAKLYKVSPKEFEFRLATSAPDPREQGKMTTITAALRYRLKEQESSP